MKIQLLDDDLDDQHAQIRRDAFDVGLAIGIFFGAFVVALIVYLMGAR